MSEWRCEQVFGEKKCDKASDYKLNDRCLCEEHWCEIMDIPYWNKENEIKR